MQDIKNWMGRLPVPTAEEPELFNALYVTNFAPHYQGEGLAGRGEWAVVKPFYAGHPLDFDLTGMIDHALNNHQRVPAIDRNGEVLE